ncbi:sugar ABC transporter substrate-binding protein [Clostridium omnivorum]|uniref:Maltodextrin-binding protein n=1 Tax=Clostridium omnivorum TaxID=1604902 RepID=A0ABQ5N7J4_9CLOT|nr:maltose ABC transporter substrate-binding protein [Clostridium sp. E14]GLC31015.1 cyclodextrin-binding protein [Clostridium sp. E14]
MKNTKRVVALACTVILAAGVLAGCGKKDDASTTTTGDSKKVTINFWEQDDANAQKTLDGLIKDFQDKNPNITVKRTHYETEDLRKNYTSASLGTTGPDVVLGPNDNIGVFVTGSLIQPVDEVIGADALKNYDSKALEAAKYQGKQYMLPDRNGNELLLMYNKKLVPTAPKTFEELIETSKKLQADKKVQYGLVFNEVEPFFSIPFLAAFGGSSFDDVNSKTPKPTLNTQAVKDWMTFLLKLKTDGIIPKEADGTVADSLFKDGKVAFVINGPWGFADYQKAGIDFGIMPIPTVNGKSPAPLSAVKGYTVSASVKDKDKKDAVKKFLEFVNTKEAQLKMVDAHKQIPTNLEAMKDDKITKDPLILGQKDALDKAVPMPIIPQMRAIWDAMKPVQQEVLSGKTKPEDSAAKMQKTAEDGIKALGF